MACDILMKRPELALMPLARYSFVEISAVLQPQKAHEAVPAT